MKQIDIERAFEPAPEMSRIGRFVLDTLHEHARRLAAREPATEPEVRGESS